MCPRFVDPQQRYGNTETDADQLFTDNKQFSVNRTGGAGGPGGLGGPGGPGGGLVESGESCGETAGECCETRTLAEPPVK